MTKRQVTWNIDYKVIKAFKRYCIDNDTYYSNEAERLFKKFLESEGYLER